MRRLGDASARSEPARAGGRGAAVVALALPVFVAAGWPRALGARRDPLALRQGLGVLLSRLQLGADNLASG